VGALFKSFVEVGNLLAVGLVVTMGEVETSDVHSSVNQVDKLVNRVAGWPKCADDFGSSLVHVDGCENVVELDAS